MYDSFAWFDEYAAAMDAVNAEKEKDLTPAPTSDQPPLEYYDTPAKCSCCGNTVTLGQLGYKDMCRPCREDYAR